MSLMLGKIPDYKSAALLSVSQARLIAARARTDSGRLNIVLLVSHASCCHWHCASFIFVL
eukprot:4725545-Pleurochrysis_carterae.AAC.1